MRSSPRHPGPEFTLGTPAAPEPPEPRLAPPARRTRTRGNNWRWLWVGIAVLAAVVVAAAVPVLAWMAWPGDGPVEPAQPTPFMPPQPTPAPTVGPPPVPHGNGAAFLSPAYVAGITELKVRGDGYGAMVGASADVGVVAVNVGHEVRGIDVATTETLWTFPSYSCSRGSWNGVALCVDDGDRGTFFRDQIPDIVGLELATGEVTFRFTPEGVPGDMTYIGSDEAHAYFILAIEGREGYFSFGQQHVLALDNDGAVAWVTALDADDMVYKAVLAAGDNVVLAFEDTIVVVEGATGAITFDQSVEAMNGSLLWLLWDGWLLGAGDEADERPYKVCDQSGTLVAEYAWVNDYVPSSMTVDTTVIPVFGRNVLNGGGRNAYQTWAVTERGDRVAGEVGGRIVDPQGNHLALGPRLVSVSADGSLFLSDRNSGSIHDARTGKVVGGFSSADRVGVVGILDGIVFQEETTVGGSTVTLLLPKAR